MDDIDKAVLTKQSCHHSLQRGDAVVGLVLGVDFAPGVEEFVGGVECAELVVHTVGDDDEGGVFEQRRYVAAVADGQLLVGVFDGGVLLDGALELKHHYRQAVQEDNGIRYAMLVPYDVVLIDNLEDFFVDNDTIDEECVAWARNIFVESFENEIIEDVNSAEWLERCSFPIGMDSDGNLWNLDE